MARRAYAPKKLFATPFELLAPTEKSVLGVLKKVYEVSGSFSGSLVTFGGTEITTNGALTVEDTATIETWYNPAITSACRVRKVEDGLEYEVIGRPENMEDRKQYMKFKVRAIRGGA